MPQWAYGQRAYGFQIEDGAITPALWALSTFYCGTVVPTADLLKIPSLADVWWHDLTSGNLYVRNHADTIWILIGNIDQSSGTFFPVFNRRVRPLNIPGPSLALLSTDDKVLINNTSGAPASLTPPITPGVNQEIELIDASRTAGASPISLTGTVNGDVNPQILRSPGAFQSLLFTGGLIYRS